MLLLDAYPVLDPEEIADVARVVAFSLSRLHAGGQAHGAVDVQHISADDAGAVSLLPGPAVGTPSEDVRALGDLILDLLASARRRPVAPTLPPSPSLLDRLLGREAARHRRLERARPSVEEALAAIARQASPEDGSAPASAAAIAAQLALRVPDARPPGRRPPPPPSSLGQAAAVGSSPPSPRPARAVVSRAGAAVAALAVFAVVAVALSAVQARRVRAPDVAPLPVPSTLPVGASRAVPAVEVEGPSGRFSLGAPDDVVLVDDWFCRGSPLPALLRPSTGEVYVFERWPDSGEEVLARAVGIVPGASSLRADGVGCPTLLAVTATGVVTVPVGARS